MNHREACRQEAVANGFGEARTIAGRQVPGRVGELLRTEIIGRRVDEVAAKRNRIGNAQAVGPVDTVRHLQPRPVRASEVAAAIAGEPV